MCEHLVLRDWKGGREGERVTVYKTVVGCVKGRGGAGAGVSPTKCCSCDVGHHEARVGASLLHKEGWQAAVGWRRERESHMVVLGLC